MMEVAISVLFSQYVCYKRARVCRYIPKFSSMLYQLNYIQARQSLEKTIQQRYSLWDVVYSHSAAIFISSFLLLHWFLYSQWSVPPVWLKQKGIQNRNGLSLALIDQAIYLFKDGSWMPVFRLSSVESSPPVINAEPPLKDTLNLYRPIIKFEKPPQKTKRQKSMRLLYRWRDLTGLINAQNL